MTPEHDLIEELIEMRSKLKRQLGLIESGKMGTGGTVIGGPTGATKARLKTLIDGLNELLKGSASADGS
jgi:hypothetical protein